MQKKTDDALRAAFGDLNPAPWGARPVLGPVGKQYRTTKGDEDMDKKTESLADALDRVVETRERREALVRRGRGNGPCDLSDSDRSFVQTMLKLYLEYADFVCVLGDRVLANDRLMEATATTIEKLGALARSLEDKSGDASFTDAEGRSKLLELSVKVMTLRDGYVIVRDRWKLPENERRRTLDLAVKIMDGIVDPLTPFAKKCARYAAKTALAQHAALEVWDTLDDVLFARQIRGEIAAMGD
jgi:hypothetical protein